MLSCQIPAQKGLRKNRQVILETREQCREYTKDKVQQCTSKCSDCKGPVINVLSGEGPGERRVAFVLEGQAGSGPEESVD